MKIFVLLGKSIGNIYIQWMFTLYLIFQINMQLVIVLFKKTRLRSWMWWQNLNSPNSPLVALFHKRISPGKENKSPLHLIATGKIPTGHLISRMCGHNGLTRDQRAKCHLQSCSCIEAIMSSRLELR